jgi:hypothetical protein
MSDPLDGGTTTRKNTTVMRSGIRESARRITNNARLMRQVYGGPCTRTTKGTEALVAIRAATLG